MTKVVFWKLHYKFSLWERLKAGGEGDDRGWNSWMASPTQWTWVWVTSGSWWWTKRPNVLLSMGLQRVGHDWAAELNWIEHCKSWELVIEELPVFLTTVGQGLASWWYILWKSGGCLKYLSYLHKSNPFLVQNEEFGGFLQFSCSNKTEKF